MASVSRRRLRGLAALFDGFSLALIGMVVLAALLPARGDAARALDVASVAGIALLFFLHGARLSRAAILAGLLHWKLQLLVLACTFGLFPLLGLVLEPLASPWLSAPLVLGFVYLSALPSTVQSSIAFTSMARGNVAAAVCSASLSNLAGVFVTPLLLIALLARDTGAAGSPLAAIGAIVLQILLPFLAGHLLRPWIGAPVARWQRLLAATDRGTILLVVYVAFSESVVDGLWQGLPSAALAATVVLSLVLLALVLGATTLLARRLGFDRGDEVVIVFCGSKKSLATGVPMAKILFAGNPALGLIVLPLMVFHQLQLMAGALLAQRYARSAEALERHAAGGP
ncbi:bile acid:sodium symporter family protein [Dokdonella sp.]|uniref:bile acid:sodium symporter family protein n=1 Tax=Dokdonella sp. TaxID=2291710 RepID=UPI0031CB744D|nr:bile acid:sodium symporter [Dokdonella sp.]